MRNRSRGILIILLWWLLPALSHAQDTVRNNALKATEKYTNAVAQKAASFNRQVEKETKKALGKILKLEKKMQRKLARSDSKAAALFNYSIDSLQKMQLAVSSRVQEVSKDLKGAYFPYLDTLQQSLAFLKKSGLGDQADKLSSKINSSLDLSQQMRSKLDVVAQVNEYLKHRKEVLVSHLSAYKGLTKDIARIKKEAWYYKARINEVKNSLNDQEKIERLVLNTLQQVPAFQKFMQQNGQLAGLFGMPASSPATGMGGGMPVVNGLPSRVEVQQSLQNSFASATPTNINQVIQQQVGAAGAELNKLRDKLNQLGGMGNTEMPDFQPNTQKTKSFRKRLEYGASIQFGQSTNYLPANCDIGFQVGYKLNDKSSIGIGTAYKLGLGKGWNNISLTNESVGLRTYAKSKLKGKIFLQGGSEWNYNMRFSGIGELKNYDAWQLSALLGVGRDYKVGKKISGNVQLLYDFLHNQHKPVTQPVMFRVGYNF